MGCWTRLELFLPIPVIRSAMGTSEWLARHPLFYARLLRRDSVAGEPAVHVLFGPTITYRFDRPNHSG